MMEEKIGRRRRPNMRRAVVLFPSGLTLANLFFGIYAIITASRGDFRMAGIWVLWGGICDALDGRVARAANAGTQFGEELDSLVDAVSFGLAPAMIMYFAVLNRDGWDWIFVFLFAACAVMRLARFNIEQAGTTKTYFQGLPSPAAGITLASYYWFSQSWLYQYGAIGNLPWQELLRFLMAALAFLMISNIPYPVLPRTGFRNVRALASSVLVFGSIGLLATKRLEFFFPLCIAYVAWGLVRSLFSRLFAQRQPTIPYDLSEGEDDEAGEEDDEFDPDARAVAAARIDRTARPPRPDRSRGRTRDAEAPHRDAAVPRADRPARPERKDRPDRGDRPERTEEEKAERAARREKRNKRQAQGERVPRPPRTDVPIDSSGDAPSEAFEGLADAPSNALGHDEIIGDIPGGADLAVADGSAVRKRKKRRRRRPDRKDRPSADGEPSVGDDGSGASEGNGSSHVADYTAAAPAAPSVPPSADAGE